MTGAYRLVHLDSLDSIRIGDGTWRPIRRALGVTAFGINAYSGASAGDELIERHDELSPGAGRHEELYLVTSGRASFEIAGDSVDAPAGTAVLIPPGVERYAVAAEPDTMVVIVGGSPGAAGPVSPFEYWYAAEPAYEAGDYDRAIAIASEGLADHPQNPTLNYQLACYHALAGNRDDALRHLRTAVDANPEVRDWATDDSDLDSIRGAPGYPG